MGRRDPVPGDLFVVPGRRLMGRVIATDAVVGPTHGSILVYVYADARLSRDALAAPPMLTTRAPWSHGLFEHLRAAPLRPGHALAAHAFHDARGALYDEQGRPVRAFEGPTGAYELLADEAIDAALARAGPGYDPPEPEPVASDDAGAAARALVVGWVKTFGRPPTRAEWDALYDVAMSGEA